MSFSYEISVTSGTTKVATADLAGGEWIVKADSGNGADVVLGDATPTFPLAASESIPRTVQAGDKLYIDCDSGTQTVHILSRNPVDVTTA